MQQGDPKVLAARSREDYLKVYLFREFHISLRYIAQVVYWSSIDNFDVLQLKQRLQLFTLGIGGVGVVSAYFSYSPEIAARYELINVLATLECDVISSAFGCFV